MAAKKRTKHASERRYQFRRLMTRVEGDGLTRVFEYLDLFRFRGQLMAFADVAMGEIRSR